MKNSMLSPYFNNLVEKKRSLLDDLFTKERVSSVLDFGAGNGKSFSEYIYRNYPSVNLTIFDTSKESLSQIKWAADSTIVSDDWEKVRNNKYDLIIASEVIEHQADPVIIMTTLRDCLSENGILLITIPNGFGFTELCSFIKKCIAQYLSIEPSGSDVFTLADSPHLSFFSEDTFDKVIRDSGFKVVRKGNVVFSHFILIRYLSDKWSVIRRLNFYFSNFMPPWSCDDWFYILSKGAVYQTKIYKISWFTKFRAKLNAKS